MNPHRKISPRTSGTVKDPLIRMDGSLSGDAHLEEGALRRLQEKVQSLSSQGPFTLDLEFSGGRFSLIILESALPKSAFLPDPESCITRILQEILDVLPPQTRSAARSTFRALWEEEGEVRGAGFIVEPPGRIAFEVRARPSEEYDRLYMERTEREFVTGARFTLPKWSVIVLGALVIAAASVLFYYLSPEPRRRALEEAVRNIELHGLKELVEIKDADVGYDGVELTLLPLENCPDKLSRLLESRDPSLERLAAEAIVKGRLHLDIFDEQGVLITSVPVILEGFDGSGPVRIRSREIRLQRCPARIRVGP